MQPRTSLQAFGAGKPRGQTTRQVVFDAFRIRTRPGAVMTPLRATEALVDWAVDWIGERLVRVADVGTGSGAVAVVLALRSPAARIWATGDSEAAVAAARTNVAGHGLEERVEVLLGNLLEPVPSELDLVVANLPYLADTRALIEACRTRLTAGGALAIQRQGRLLTTGASHLDRLAREIELANGAPAPP